MQALFIPVQLCKTVMDFVIDMLLIKEITMLLIRSFYVWVLHREKNLIYIEYLRVDQIQVNWQSCCLFNNTITNILEINRLY